MRSSLAALCALILLAACEPDEVEVDARCNPSEPLTWDNWGKGFVDTHCVGCHSSIIPPAQRRDAPVGIDFDTYRGVLLWAERIEERTLTGARQGIDSAELMPPGGGPTEEELDMLEEWLHCTVYPDKAVVEGR
ncbi:MAG: hypothetical protein EA397_06810 [Deltaproteobacteria bacterium]|nr:MAG: hypothetical protein EA397_06810 [Deltaproteobacteria bacterium]